MPALLTEHKRRVTSVFNLAALGYDRPAVQFFRLAGEHLVAFAGVERGHAVLDIATGTGAAAIPAARAVGPDGRVVGIDLASEMLVRARAKILREYLMNVELRVSDAETPPFAEGTFDVALAAASLYFLPDMGAALREWRRIVRRGGTVAFSAFGQSAFEPLSSMFADAIRGYGIPLPHPHPFAWQRLTDASLCAALLKDAGFTDVAVETRRLDVSLPDAAAWWEVICGSAFRGPVAELTREQRDQFRQEHLHEIAALATGDGIHLDVPILLAKGRKP
jgi:ubiquinone/menaquinone biosynthesis C-methylase UbiE